MNWINKEPAQYLSNLLALLGTPSLIVDRPHGAVVWYTSSKTPCIYGLPSVFTKHMLVDDITPHDVPIRHNDYFYSYIPVLLSYKQLANINRFIGSLGYDKIKKLLWVRGNNLKSNIVILKYATDIINGKRVNYKVAYKSIMNGGDAEQHYRALHKNLLAHYNRILNSSELCTELTEYRWRSNGMLGKLAAVFKSRQNSEAGKKIILQTISRILPSRENMTGTLPWYAQSPWYTTNDPLEWELGSYFTKCFVPTYRASTIAQNEKNIQFLKDIAKPHFRIGSDTNYTTKFYRDIGPDVVYPKLADFFGSIVNT